MGAEADGEVGDRDPVHAVRDAMRRQRGRRGHRLDAAASGVSRWLGEDVPSRLRDAVQVPVTVVSQSSRTDQVRRRSRPPSRTSSSHARSRPIVVSGPWPGNTRTRSSSSVRRGRATRPSPSGSPPGRSTRPQPPANSVSPLNSRPSSAVEETDRSFGVAGRVEHGQADLPEPDLAALGQLDGRDGRHDLERRPAAAGWSAARGRADGPRSRRRCARRPPRCRRCGPSDRGVETISLSVQSRAASSSAIQASARRRGIDGDRLARARIGQHVDVGRDRADDPVEALHVALGARRPDQAASSFVFMQSKVWPIILLAVPSISRAPTLASVPGDVHVGRTSPSRPAGVAVGQAHLRRRRRRRCRRLAVGLDRRPAPARPARRSPCSRRSGR